jgi:hypothetical protein
MPGKARMIRRCLIGRGFPGGAAYSRLFDLPQSHGPIRIGSNAKICHFCALSALSRGEKTCRSVEIQAESQNSAKAENTVTK